MKYATDGSGHHHYLKRKRNLSCSEGNDRPYTVFIACCKCNACCRTRHLHAPFRCRMDRGDGCEGISELFQLSAGPSQLAAPRSQGLLHEGPIGEEFSEMVPEPSSNVAMNVQQELLAQPLVSRGGHNPCSRPSVSILLSTRGRRGALGAHYLRRGTRGHNWNETRPFAAPHWKRPTP